MQLLFFLPKFDNKQKLGLADFVLNDDRYRSYAYKICGCHYLKNDIVNDFYIKLDSILKKEPKKEISNRYVYLMLRSIFFDIKRKEVEIYTDMTPEGITDHYEEERLCERITMDNVLGEMNFFDREILLKSQEKSFRKIGEQINCHHTTVSKIYTKSLEKAKKICLEKGIKSQR